jgi:hypothetical protein
MPDPRRSTPVRLEDDVVGLMHRHPNAIAWIAGHSHRNGVKPISSPNGTSGFWSIRTSALADWPRQNRLIEVFDNRDGTLSIFGTVIDHAALAAVPAPGTSAGSMDELQLASLARTIGYNGNHAGGAQCACGPCGEGRLRDRKVELLVDDPRKRISGISVNTSRRAVKPFGRVGLTVRVRIRVKPLD